jgi:hypothetical protein
MALGTCLPAAAQSSDADLTSLQKGLDTYLATRAEPEHISAASLSILLKSSKTNINLAAGTTKYPDAGAQVTPADLFQIGSITKSFTSVAIPHRGHRQTHDRGHARPVAAAISGVEVRHDPPVARHDEPDPGLRQRSADRLNHGPGCQPHVHARGTDLASGVRFLFWFHQPHPLGKRKRAAATLP